MKQRGKKTARRARALAVTAGIAGILGALPASAEEERGMSTVVVTATRNPMEEFKAPANISVVTRESLENNHYPDIGAALKDVPGVTIQNYGSSGGNYTSNSLLINGSANVVVLIDGMRANTNGSVSNKFSASEWVDMNMIERIEVLKGSASTLYGSDAQGGVINIITRRPAQAHFDTTLGFTGGSYGLQQYNFRHAGSREGFYWALTGQKKSSGNFQDGKGNTVPEKLESTTFNVQLGKKFADGVSSLELNYNQYDADYMRPSNVSLGNLAPANGKKNNSRLALAYVQKINDALTNRLSLFQNQNNLKDKYDTPASRWFMDLETRGFSDQLTYTGESHVLTGGVDYYEDLVKDYFSGGSGYKGKSLSSTAFFIQDEWRFAPGWTATPGIRFDRHSTYGSHTSPALTVNYLAGQQTNLYLSYKEYFVAPNQFQLFSATYGNPGLKPESGQTIEAGVKHQFDPTLNGALNVYTRKSTDVVIFDGGIAPLGKYRNVATEKAQGASLTLSKSFLKYFTANAGYTYTHVNAQPGANANRDGALPRDVWNLGLNYTQDKFSADLSVRGSLNKTGRRADPYPGVFKDYWIVDVAVNYQPIKGGRIFARLNNLFDKYYTDRSYERNPAKWYTQPGRNFQLGLDYTF